MPDVSAPSPDVPAGPAVIVGVDGSGRTHRLGQIAAAAAARGVIRVNPPIGDTAQLDADLAAVGERLVLVDDAHRLTEDQAARLVAAARRGVAMVIARRPTIPTPAHAELDEAVGGPVEQLRPLDETGVARILSARTGHAVSPEQVADVWARSGGLPAIVAALAEAPADGPNPSLVARIHRRLTMVPPPVAALAKLLALRLDLPDTVLAAAARLDPAELGPAIRELTDQGMVLAGAETMIPAVADALLADLPAAERRRVHESVASALIAVGADPLTAATQLRAARAYVPTSAAVFAAAAERLRFDDPAAALGWYDDAITAGADPASIAVGRAEVAVLLGLSTDAPAAANPDQATRAAIVAGTIEAHHGRCDRATEALLAAGSLGPLLAVPSLVAVGDLARAQSVDVSGVDAPVALRRLAEAALTAAARPAAAVPLFIEAAEALERTSPTTVLPDTAHALGAVLSSIVGDVASAEHLLERAIALGYGGPAFVARHRLLLAWVRMRGGRYDTALLELGQGPTRLPEPGQGPASGSAATGGTTTPGGVATASLAGAFGPAREVVLRAALRAGIARRSGDIAALRDAWTGVEPALARRTVDIFSVEPLEELVVAAARLRQHGRVALVMEALDTILHRLGSPPDWAVVVGWIHLQVAIAAEDADAAARAAERIADACRHAGSPRQKAQCAAAELWARILAGDVDPDAATIVAGELAAVGLPWEGSRLVGQAAIRTTDASAARRLLERARELSSAEVVPDRGRAESAHGGLSEREVEVARMVLAGDTYREIGAKLFISPKTVEHHVARIRAKVGATTRAEFVAALRSLLQTDQTN